MTPATDAWPLICPLCREALSRSPTALACPSGHSFDLASEGYVNLLPPQHRTRGIEGDLPEMLRARRRFLEAGHFGPLRDRLTAIAAGELGRAARCLGADRLCVAEAGCGEGYYLGGIARGAARDLPVPVTAVGIDLAKEAARLAARRYPEAVFAVGDVNRGLPLADGSASLLLNIFSPRNPVEFARVAAPGGMLVVVLPAPDHLADLVATLHLLGVQEEKEALVVRRLAEGFQPAGREELRLPLALTAGEVGDLVTMGPSHRHRPSRAGSGDFAPAAAEASFVVLIFRRA